MVQSKQLTVWLALFFGGLTVMIMGAIGSPILLDTFAPSPEQFEELPLRLASNPSDAAHWDFSDLHPTLHPGDQLVGEFHVCYSDVFGGPTVQVESKRSLVSIDGKTRAALNTTTITFTVGCHDTRTVIDNIPTSFPPGTYYLDASATAIAAHYYHVVPWRSVEFDVQ